MDIRTVGLQGHFQHCSQLRRLFSTQLRIRFFAWPPDTLSGLVPNCLLLAYCSLPNLAFDWAGSLERASTPTYASYASLAWPSERRDYPDVGRTLRRRNVSVFAWWLNIQLWFPNIGLSDRWMRSPGMALRGHTTF